MAFKITNTLCAIKHVYNYVKEVCYCIIILIYVFVLFCFFFIFLETEGEMPDEVWEKLLQQLRKTKPEDEKGDPIRDNIVQEFQIWDFAGQDVYYTTHQV